MISDAQIKRLLQEVFNRTQPGVEVVEVIGTEVFVDFPDKEVIERYYLSPDDMISMENAIVAAERGDENDSFFISLRPPGGPT